MNRLDAVAGWTTERIGLLRKYWSQGLSAREIATKLGGGVTRNAVIGKVRRLNLPPHKPAASKKIKFVRKDTDKPKPNPSRGTVHSNGATAPPVAKAQKHVAHGNNGHGVTFMELRAGMCPFPLWSTRFNIEASRYCGGNIEHGKYCTNHQGIMYTGVPPARSRDRKKPFRLGM